MSSGHFELVPTIALQLAVQVERYRHATRAVSLERADSSSRAEASAAIRAAGPLAFAVPAVWASWSDMIVRHAVFMQEWLRAGSPRDLHRAWRHLEDRSEIVVQRCVDWSLHRQKRVPIDPGIAESFLAWDQARREAFELGRQLEAMTESLPGTSPLLEAVQERLEERSRISAQLLDQASNALNRTQVAFEAVQTDEPSAYESLHEQWRLAEEAVTAAELAIIEIDLMGLPVEAAQREHVAELRAIALERREAFMRAGRL